MNLNQVKLSKVLAPAFFNIHNFIKNETYSDYYLKGGRGSCKSSTPSIEIVYGIMKDINANAMCVMKVGTSIETGVFNQIQWAIDMLEVGAYWKANKNNYSFTYTLTGQRIFCRGCDDASKFKSVKLVRGYFKYQWFEEVDAFDGIAEIRKVQQSLTRAGLTRAIRFYTYNPPKTIDHWVNRFILELQKDITEGKVTNSIIADGCVIEGVVENSILFRGVKVGKGTVIKNSILLQNTYTGEDVYLNCVVTDKDVTIKNGKMLSGHETLPFYIGKGTTV